jgi:hypothetical protein
LSGPGVGRATFGAASPRRAPSSDETTPWPPPLSTTGRRNWKPRRSARQARHGPCEERVQHGWSRGHSGGCRSTMPTPDTSLLVSDIVRTSPGHRPDTSGHLSQMTIAQLYRGRSSQSFDVREPQVGARGDATIFVRRGRRSCCEKKRSQEYPLFESLKNTWFLVRS